MCDRWLKQRLTGRRTTAVTRVVQLYAQNLTEQHGSNKGKLDRDLLERWADYVHGVYVLMPPFAVTRPTTVLVHAVGVPAQLSVCVSCHS